MTDVERVKILCDLLEEKHSRFKFMKEIFWGLVMCYCAICRHAFEFGSVIMLWFVFNHFWAGVLTAAFLLWQIVGYFLIKHLSK